MTARAEELAAQICVKVGHDGDNLKSFAEYADVVAAIETAMREVRKRDAEIPAESTAHTAYQSKQCYRFASYCAAAISREPLP